MDITRLLDLYRHMEWADALAWSAVSACAPAVADTRIRDLLYHIHLVEHAFLRAWRAEGLDQPFPTFDGLAPIMGWAREFHGQAPAFVSALADDDLARPMPLAWAAMVERAIGRPPAPTTLGDTVLQVALHGVHHRAQVNARLRELGATPPLVDYIGWIFLGRPAAEWPSLGR